MVGWETVPMTSTKPVGNGQTPRLDVATDGGRATSAALRLLKTISGEQIFDFLEDLPIGVLLFDQDDRLVRYNRKALEVAEQNAAA